MVSYLLYKYMVEECGIGVVDYATFKKDNIEYPVSQINDTIYLQYLKGGKRPIGSVSIQDIIINLVNRKLITNITYVIKLSFTFLD